MTAVLAFLAPWLAGLMAALIVVDSRQTPKRILAGFGDGNALIVRLYVDHGMRAVRWYFAACMGLLAGAFAVVAGFLGRPALFTALLLPFLAAEIYCVAGNFRRGFNP